MLIFNCFMMSLHKALIFLIGILSGNLPSSVIQAEPLQGNNVTKVDQGKYPYIVSIAGRNDRIPAEELHICTGVLITNKFVLTAAHCFDGRLLGEIRVIVGSVDLHEGKKYDPSMWITYNQWAEKKNITKMYSNNDMALIKLSEKVESKVAKPASLSSKTNKDLDDQYVVLVGWGMTNQSPNVAARYLHEVKVKALSIKVCENIVYDLFKRRMPIPPKYLCTKGEPHAFLAHGDSGGPVIRKNSVVGISRSTCPKHGICDLPEAVINDHKLNIHTGIDFYREFIADVLKNL